MEAERTSSSTGGTSRVAIGPVTGGFIGFVVGVFAGLGFSGVMAFFLGFVGADTLTGYLVTLSFGALVGGTGGAATGIGARTRSSLIALAVVGGAGTLYGLVTGGPRAALGALIVAGSVAAITFVACERAAEQRAGR